MLWRQPVRRSEMATRSSCALLMFAFLGVVLLLQTSLAFEVGNVGSGDDITSSGNADIDSWEAATSRVDQDFADGGQSAAEDLVDEHTTTNAGDVEELGEIQPYLYVPDQEDEVDVFGVDKDQKTTTSEEAAVHPLARMLYDRSLRCYWNARVCYKIYRWAGCCKRKCANLSNDNKNCGKCARSCDTRSGYSCRLGKCRKPNPPPTPMCSKTKKCNSGNSCCAGNCVSVMYDRSNCGSCGHQCPIGSACCNKQCKNLNADSRNCGKCGRQCYSGAICCNGQCVSTKQNHFNCGQCGQKCAWGQKCCNGKCVSVKNDINNCGSCGHKCAKHVKCNYGICGYAL